MSSKTDPGLRESTLVSYMLAFNDVVLWELKRNEESVVSSELLMSIECHSDPCTWLLARVFDMTDA